ncbi:MAG: hypothetical protein ABFS35_21960 [Bacteroidota bacterium]
MIKYFITFCFIINSFIIFSQNLYSDKTIKEIRNYYNQITSELIKVNPEVFTFSETIGYIDKNGDTTLYEGEGDSGDQKISIYKINNRIVRIVDFYSGSSGSYHEGKTEYTIKNDTLIFVFVSQGEHSYDMNLGNPTKLKEERIYYNKGKPYVHVKREFDGLAANRKSFYKQKSEIASKKHDNFYIELLQEILTNYKSNNMSYYDNKYER